MTTSTKPSLILGNQLTHLQSAGSITVKGLAEANYQANFAQMQMGIATWGLIN